MPPINKTIEAGGVKYTFRLPSSKEMIQLDLDALQMRGGVSDGVPLAYAHSQNLAALNLLCTSPDNVNFEDLDFHVVNKLGGGLWKWLNSFSEAPEKAVGKA